MADEIKALFVQVLQIAQAKAQIEAAAAQAYEQAQAQFEAKQAERERRKNEGRRPPGPSPTPPSPAVDPNAQVNLTDADSRIMKISHFITACRLAVPRSDDPCIHTDRGSRQVRQAARSQRDSGARAAGGPG